VPLRSQHARFRWSTHLLSIVLDVKSGFARGAGSWMLESVLGGGAWRERVWFEVDFTSAALSSFSSFFPRPHPESHRIRHHAPFAPSTERLANCKSLCWLDWTTRSFGSIRNPTPPPLDRTMLRSCRRAVTSSSLLAPSIRPARLASPAATCLKTMDSRQRRTASAHAISNPTLAGIEKRWEAMPPQEQANLWMALRDRMKADWHDLTLQEKKAGQSKQK
jgi:hypothetical protein